MSHVQCFVHEHENKILYTNICLRHNIKELSSLYHINNKLEAHLSLCSSSAYILSIGIQVHGRFN
jgi:hypothetical protein